MEDQARFSMTYRRRIQGIFQVNDTVVFILNLALQLSQQPYESITDIEVLCAKYDLSVEDATKLSLAARLLKDQIPLQMLDLPTSVALPAEPNPEETTSSTLFIRNIPVNTTEAEVYGVFSHFGEIKDIRMQRDKQTGSFTGSAFVEFTNPAVAKNAYSQINMKQWGNNTVHANFAKERNTNTTTSQEEKSASPHLFVANLPLEIDRASLFTLFGRFGTITDVRILNNKTTGLPKGVAFIDFSLTENAASAKEEMNGMPFLGKALKVSFASAPATKKNEQPSTPTTNIASGSTLTPGFSGYPEQNFYGMPPPPPSNYHAYPYNYGK